MLKNKDLITSHLKKKAQSKLTLSISAFAVIITSTGYLFNSKETYNSLLAVPGTIKITEILNENISYNGIWTSSMILTFVFALTGIQLSPNMSMLTFASKEVKYFGTQQKFREIRI